MAVKTGLYEGLFLFGTAATTNVDGSLELAKTFITRHGGEIKLLKKWDERRLAYEVKKQKRGLYVLAFFTAPGTAVAAITRDCNLSEDVLRVMITDASHLNEEEMNAQEAEQPAKEKRREDFEVPEGASAV